MTHATQNPTADVDTDADSDAAFMQLMQQLFSADDNGGDGESTDRDGSNEYGDAIDGLLGSLANGFNEGPHGGMAVAKPKRNKRGPGKHSIDLHHPDTDDILGSLNIDCPAEGDEI